jgi:hypothetical protein
MGRIRGFERGNVGDFRDGSKPKNRRVVGRDGLSERAAFGVETLKKRVRERGTPRFAVKGRGNAAFALS